MYTFVRRNSKFTFDLGDITVKWPIISSGSSGWVRGGEKHEIYVAAYGGHLFCDLFSQGRGGRAIAPSAPPDLLLIMPDSLVKI